MPRHYRIRAVGYIFDFVLARFVGVSKVRSGGNDDVACHLRMHIAEQRHCTWVIKLERSLLAFWPRSQVVRQLLVAANRGPEDVVRYSVTVQEVNRCSNLYRNH